MFGWVWRLGGKLGCTGCFDVAALLVLAFECAFMVLLVLRKRLAWLFVAVRLLGVPGVWGPSLSFCGRGGWFVGWCLVRLLGLLAWGAVGSLSLFFV